MKVKRMGMTEILRRIWLFSANKIKILVNNQLNSSLRHIIVTKVRKLSLGGLWEVQDEHINMLVVRCNRLFELDIDDTGKSLSEGLIFASTNLQYNDRLFIELQVQFMKIPSSNMGRTCCVQKFFLTFRLIFVHNLFSTCSAKRRTSDKDLPLQKSQMIRLSALWNTWSRLCGNLMLTVQKLTFLNS